MSKAIYTHEPNMANKRQLKELIDLLGQYKTIGISRVENIASKTIQKLRHSLRGEATLKVGKNTLMKLAIKEHAKKDKQAIKLLDYVRGSCAFILTNGNAFKISHFLDKNKIPTAAKEGQIAPKDVLVTARDTGFAPGPVIGDLQSAGFKTRIEGGTVKIIEDATVCKAGDKISKNLANVLGRLGVEPFDAGLSIEVMYSAGNLMTSEDLSVDFDGIISDMVKAHQDAFALSIEAQIPTKDNINLLLGKTRKDALALAMETSFITPETAGNILAKSQLEAMILAKSIAAKDPDVLPAEIVASASASPTAQKPSASQTATKAEEEDDDEDEGAGISLFG